MILSFKDDGKLEIFGSYTIKGPCHQGYISKTRLMMGNFAFWPAEESISAHV